MMFFKLSRKFSSSLVRPTLLPKLRRFSSNSSDESDPIYPKSKFKIFQDDDSPVILDVTEERSQHQKSLLPPSVQQNEQFSIEYNRGVTGVFDIEDLVETLRKDKAEDIFVAKVPQELNYVNHIVIVTGRSRRHIIGLGEYIRSLYKKKRHSSDLIPEIEGENSSEWVALDLGNIALHIMSESAREKYDLESLWSLGSKYDIHSIVDEDKVLELIKKHSVLLDDLRPLETG